MVKFEFDREHANWLRPHADNVEALLAEKAQRYVETSDKDED